MIQKLTRGLLFQRTSSSFSCIIQCSITHRVFYRVAKEESLEEPTLPFVLVEKETDCEPPLNKIDVSLEERECETHVDTMREVKWTDQKDASPNKDKDAHASFLKLSQSIKEEKKRLTEATPRPVVVSQKKSKPGGSKHILLGKDSEIDYYRGQIAAIEEQFEKRPHSVLVAERVLRLIKNIESLEPSTNKSSVMDLGLYNTKLKCLLVKGDRLEAYETLLTMEHQGLIPDHRTFEILLNDISQLKASYIISLRLLEFMTRKYQLIPNQKVYIALMRCIKSYHDLPKWLQYYQASKGLENSEFLWSSDILEDMLNMCARKKLFPAIRIIFNDMKSFDKKVRKEREAFKQNKAFKNVQDKNKNEEEPFIFDTLISFPTYKYLLEGSLETSNLDLVITVFAQIRGFQFDDAFYLSLFRFSQRQASLQLSEAILKSLMHHKIDLKIDYYLCHLDICIKTGRIKEVFKLLKYLEENNLPLLLHDLSSLVNWFVGDENVLLKAEGVLPSSNLEASSSEEVQMDDDHHYNRAQNKSHIPTSFYHAILIAHAYLNNTLKIESLLSSMTNYNIPVDLFHYHVLLYISGIRKSPKSALLTLQKMTARKLPPTLETMKILIPSLFSNPEDIEDLNIVKNYWSRFCKQKSPSSLFLMSVVTDFNEASMSIKAKLEESISLLTENSNEAKRQKIEELNQCLGLIKDMDQIIADWIRVSK